jgi:hypothetical protein
LVAGALGGVPRHFLVLASSAEGMAIVLLMANAHGLPDIGTRIGQRFVVTSLPASGIEGRTLYEDVYFTVVRLRTGSTVSNSISSPTAWSRLPL